MLIHGSGPHSRDAPLSAQLNMSFGFEIPVFAEIAMLVLNGELDWNVDVSETEAWKGFLADVGADHEVVTLPCITHALNCVTESNPAAITADDLGTEVAPEVIAALVDFLTR